MVIQPEIQANVLLDIEINSMCSHIKALTCRVMHAYAQKSSTKQNFATTLRLSFQSLDLSFLKYQRAHLF